MRRCLEVYRLNNNLTLLKECRCMDAGLRGGATRHLQVTPVHEMRSVGTPTLRLGGGFASSLMARVFREGSQQLSDTGPGQ
jgi:hypothetical protein